MPRKCKGSWLDSYLEYTSNQESPTAFHEWVGLSMLSATLGRHIWIPRIKYTLFPNIFVILVATSGMCRKSTGIDIGVDLLRNIKNSPMIFAQKITVEALIQALELAKVDGASAGLVCAKELSVFMGSDATKSGIIPALTDLYDSPKEWIYHTRSRGKEILRNVTVSVIAASTREWLKSSIPADAVGGGFTSRIVFVSQDRPSKPMLFETVNPYESQLKSSLIYDLSEIRNAIKGPIGFTPRARSYAEDWYKREFYKVRDGKLEGYFARKHDTMFKIASILSAAEGSNRLIDVVHIVRALELLEENEKNLGDVIEGVVATTVGGETERVYTLIKKYKKIQHSDLLRHCWRFATAERVNEMLRTLIESKEIKEAFDGKTKFYEMNERRR